MSHPDRIGTALVRIAAVYMVLGAAAGMFIGITKRMQLASVHAHAALLGWATLGLAGLVYLVLPRCARSPLARAHFWLHNAGLPVMLVALVLLAEGRASAEPAIGLGSALVLVGLLAFTVNVLRNATPEEASTP